MKYKYWKPINTPNSRKCHFCRKKNSNCIDNVGTPCHWQCAELSEAPE